MMTSVSADMDRHCTTCWWSVLNENVKTGRRKRNCLKNDGMQVNRRMVCEEWSDDGKTK